MSPLQLAKTFYSIPVLCREIYPDWREPRRPGEACSAPYRQDRKPSFSIIPGSAGRLAHDFGEGKTYDAVSFHARALGLSLPDAAKDLIRRYRARGGSAAPPAPISSATPPAWQSSKKPVLPRMDEGTHDDRLALARLRNVCLEAVELLIDRGMIRFCGHRSQRAWVITDATRRSAQRRRLDGKLWYNNQKVIGFSGVSNGWPCGIHDAARRRRVAIVEGGPDALAAMHFALAQGCEDSVGIVALLGAAVRIPDECIPFFGERHVRIFIHDDGEKESGMKAARAWAEQIRGTAGRVDGVTFEDLVRSDGEPVRDLNDLCSVDPVSYEARRDFVDGIMDF